MAMMKGGRSIGGLWKHSLKYAAEYATLRLLVGFLHILPLDFASWAMGMSWRLIAPHLSRHKRALRHLEAAYPEKSREQIEHIARNMWMQLGRTFAESLMLDRIIRSGRIEDRSGMLLQTLQQREKGIVFVSLHTGNWELVATPTTARGIKVAGIYQRMKNSRVDAYITGLRAKRYPRGLFAKGADTGRKLIRIVKEGGSIALLADLRDRRGEVVDFFGHPAPTTTFPALLCRNSNAALVAARTVRLKGVRFFIEAIEIDIPQTADRNADVIEVTRRIQQQFESWIRQYPEQWMWAHRRWG